MGFFILRFWSTVFAFLASWSLFEVMHRQFTKSTLFSEKSTLFSDIWVLVYFALAPIALAISSILDIGWVTTVFVFYGIARVYEFLIYQANVVLFNHYRQGKDYFVRSYLRLVVISIHNYIELIFWFALFYFHMSHDFTKPDVVHTFTGAIYYSMVTMATLGYGDIYPEKELGRWIVIIHLVVSLFLTLVITARFISFLPRPKLLEESDKDEGST